MNRLQDMLLEKRYGGSDPYNAYWRFLYALCYMASAAVIGIEIAIIIV